MAYAHITQTTKTTEINQYISEQVARQMQALIYQLCDIGEQVVNHARLLPSPSAAQFKGGRIPPHQPHYIDWTANLRSSIGYVVAVDGEIVQISNFEPIRGGTEGSDKGRAYVKTLVKEHPQGIALIVVAGMEYASYVTGNGYDVIDSAELLAERLMSELQTKLNEQDQ